MAGIADCFDDVKQIPGDILTGLYSQINSVAYKVSCRGATMNLQIFSAACSELDIVYAYQKPGGSFLRETWRGGMVTVTHSCNNNPDSILLALMWGRDVGAKCV